MSRLEINHFQEIPNVGKAAESDFISIGICKPQQLIGKDPYQMFKELCTKTNIRHDPCVIDVFISAVKYMEGGLSKKWWEFTEERKIKMGVS